MSRQILFVPLHTPSMLEMMPIAQQIADDGQYQPCFFIYRDIPDKSIEPIRQKGFAVIGLHLFGQANKGNENGSSQVEMKVGTSGWREQIKKLARLAQSITITSFIITL